MIYCIWDFMTSRTRVFIINCQYTRCNNSKNIKFCFESLEFFLLGFSNCYPRSSFVIPEIQRMPSIVTACSVASDWEDCLIKLSLDFRRGVTLTGHVPERKSLLTLFPIATHACTWEALHRLMTCPFSELDSKSSSFCSFWAGSFSVIKRRVLKLT